MLIHEAITQCHVQSAVWQCGKQESNFVLMQVVMPDSEYREQANELAIALSEPHVKGVFEERLPLDLHAAIQLGCVTAVTPQSRSKCMQDGFDLTDLQV